jgi:acyl-CoA ligase (AMP-forming) (exosortase A-associated)
LNDPPRALDHLALAGARDAPALIDKLGVLDHAALDDAVGAAAAGLRARGLAPGDRVATWLAKTRLAAIMPLAAARAGLIHVPVNPLLKRAQVAHILADSGARLLIAGEARAATLTHGNRPEACALLPEAKAEATLLGHGDRARPSMADPEELAAILYTSGSTGRPKGVMLSHANMWLGAVSVASYLKLAAEDRTLCVLPFSFDYGQNQLFSTWAAGGAIVPLDYLTPRDVIRAVDRYGITTLAGVPPLWTQLVEATWPDEVALRPKRLTNSGGRLPVPLVRAMRARFPAADLYSMYGLTEAFRSTYLDPALIDAHPDAIGSAIPLAEIMVVTPDGALAADGEPGELVHAGPLVAKGYWQDAERTSQRFKPAPAQSAYGGTAVFSGDTVVRGADGLLRFVGRDDEMIKTAGNRVSPTEIEEAAIASGHTPEAVAFGMPDARLGQSILLVARRPVGQADAGALAAALRAELPGFMQPHRIEWRDELPRNPNGKLDRTALRGMMAV